jgi:hypothetical protein
MNKILGLILRPSKNHIDEIYNAIVDKQNLSDNKCGTETYLREFTGIKKRRLRIT